MKIGNFNQANKIIDLYGKNKSMKNEFNKPKKTFDKVEISSLGKTLSSLNFDDIETDNSKKIEILKNKIKNGSYKVDTEKLAKSMIDNIKGDKI